MLCTAVIIFATQDALTKHLTARFPIGLLAWGRYLVHWILMTAFLAPRWRSRLLATHKPGAMVIRGLLLAAVTVLMMIAFKRMPLAEATTIIFASPLLVMIAARPLLGEKISGLRWLAVVTGFIGVLLLTRPGSGLDPVGVACALVSALCYTGYQLLTRHLIATEHPVTQLYYTACAGTLCLTASLPLIGPAPMPDIPELIQICALGIFGGGGHYLVTRAFRDAPASLLAPLMYTQLIWAVLLGWVFYADVPQGLSLLGMLIIASSGLLIALDGRRGLAAAAQAA